MQKQFDIVEIKETVSIELATRMATSKTGAIKLEPMRAKEWKDINVSHLPARKRTEAYNAYKAEWGRKIASHVQNQTQALGMAVKYATKRANGDLTVVYKGEQKSKIERQAEALAALTGQDLNELKRLLEGA